MIRLGVNIDHIATLRQARGEFYPRLTDAAKISLESGADQITIHLREDRRHIQDSDVFEIKKITDKFNKPLNFEMGSHPEIINIACDLAPEWVCLVPEKREEQTTEGGLDLKSKDQFQRIESAISLIRLKSKQSKISLFLESDPLTLRLAQKLEVEAVEIHTGCFAKNFINQISYEKDLNSFSFAQQELNKFKIGCHAGHGLTNQSVLPLLELGCFEEYNIGHWIICESVFKGLGQVVSDLKKLFLNYEVIK